MKLLTFKVDGRERVGVLSACENAAFPVAEAGLSVRDMNDLIDRWDEDVINRLSYLSEKDAGCESTQKYYSMKDIEILAPIPHPKQDIICLGINYMAHAEESARYKKEAFGGERPYPVYFSKRVGTAVPDGGIIKSHPGFVQSLDYEVELAVIIKKACSNVSMDEARDYILGYTIINDVSARQIQTRHKQWYFGKSLDGFTPMGPWIVTADEINYPPALGIQSKVNGELRQDSNTELMIHNIDYVISELSQGMTLLPGTIIATGTPAGVGMGFDPPNFLKSGDTVECLIEGIGSITNTVE